jgi:hypothetical protein
MMKMHGVDLAPYPKCKTKNMERVATCRRGVLYTSDDPKAEYQPSIADKNKDSPNP